jgi:hypothetical protein
VQFLPDQDEFNDADSIEFLVVPGAVMTVPLEEDMEGFSLCGVTNNCEAENCTLGNGWNNLDNGNGDAIDWRVNSGDTPSPDTGPSADYVPGTASGKYIYIEGSSCFEKEAILMSSCIDLSGTTAPHLRFAYSMKGSGTGTLVAELLSGYQWIGLFRKDGEQPGEWSTATIDLSAYAGQTVLIRFRGITGTSEYSDIALDGIAVSEILSEFSVQPGICLDSLVTFTDQSIGNVTSYSWNFGSDAVPSSDTTQGPHAVRFTTTGQHTVQLTVNGPEGVNTYTQFIDVYAPPAAALTFSQNNSTVQFFNNSQNAESYYWQFGDGDTSTQASPVHTYSTNGTYFVTLTASNPCSADDTTFVIQVTISSIEPETNPFSVTVYPNPASDQVYLLYNYLEAQELLIELLDATGRTLLQVEETAFPEKILSLPISSFTNGIYLLKISTGGRQGVYRLVISR